MGKGMFAVSFELLANVLHLPEDAKVLGVNEEWQADGFFHVLVEHPDISGEYQERLNPTHETDYDGGKTRYGVKFVGWG